jgi:hypothetical protein
MATNTTAEQELLGPGPCILAGGSGVRRVDQATFRQLMLRAPYIINRFTLLDDAQVRLLAQDAAVVAYRIHEELTVQGRSVTLDAADASTWVRRNGSWACAMHTEAVLGDLLQPARPA